MLESLGHPAPSDAVLVHGAGETATLWRGVLGRLSGQRKAMAVNLPGHPVGEITCRSVGEYAEAVHGFIAEAGLVRPAVCGHSMGGAVALTLALDHPDDVGGLVLVGTGAKLGVLPEILDGLRDDPLGLIEKTLTPMSFFKVTLETARAARASLALSNQAVFLNDYLACNGFDVRDRVGQISAKALIVCGENDRMTPPRWSRYLREHLPSASLSFVSEAGHMVPLEKPEACGDLIQEFLATLNL